MACCCLQAKWLSQWCRNRGSQGGHCPPPQYFADQLTLFEPGRADYPHLLLLAPQYFSPSGITVLSPDDPDFRGHRKTIYIIQENYYYNDNYGNCNWPQNTRPWVSVMMTSQKLVIWLCTLPPYANDTECMKSYMTNLISSVFLLN